MRLTTLFRMFGFWWLLLAPLADIAVALFGVPVATFWHLAYHEDDTTGLLLTRVSIMTIALVGAIALDLALQSLLNRLEEKGNDNVSVQ